MKCLTMLSTLVLLVACAGSGGGSATLQIEITTPADRDPVAGMLTVAGWASGGRVDVAVDGDSVGSAAMGHWTIAVDTSSWSHGWHIVEARVRNGAAQVSDRVSLYCENVIAPPPIVVEPAPPPAPPSSSGLVAHWGFNAVSCVDISGNGHHGTVYGAPAASGRFDGTDDRAAIPDEPGPVPAAIGDLAYGTITVRFKYDSIYNGAGIADFLPLFYMGAGPGASADEWDCLSIYVSHGELQEPTRRQIYFTVYKGNVGVTLCFDSIVSLEPDTWYDYAVVIAPSGHRAYLNREELVLHYNAGTTADSYAYLATVADKELLALGYGWFPLTGRWWHFAGAIDEVRIYDRALTPAEIE